MTYVYVRTRLRRVRYYRSIYVSTLQCCKFIALHTYDNVQILPQYSYYRSPSRELFLLFLHLSVWWIKMRSCSLLDSTCAQKLAVNRRLTHSSTNRDYCKGRMGKDIKTAHIWPATIAPNIRAGSRNPAQIDTCDPRTFGTQHLRSKEKKVLFFSNSDSNKPSKHRQSLGTGFGTNLVRT